MSTNRLDSQTDTQRPKVQVAAATLYPPPKSTTSPLLTAQGGGRWWHRASNPHPGSRS